MNTPKFVKTKLSDEELEALSLEDAKTHIRDLESEYANTQSNYDKEVDKNIKFNQQHKSFRDASIVKDTQISALRRQIAEVKQTAEDRRVTIQWYQKRYGTPKGEIKPKLNIFQRLIARIVGI